MRTRIKKWCPKDIQKLTVLYYMGATDQIIATLLNRSSQSIGKKITRLKLRPSNSESHVITPGKHLPKEINSADLAQHLIQEIKILEGSENFMKKLLERYPLSKRPKLAQHNTPSFERLEDGKGQWRSLKEVGKFIQNRHHSVTEEYCSQTGTTHIINGQRKRPLDLLMLANKIRLRDKKEIFFLKNHTQY